MGLIERGTNFFENLKTFNFECYEAKGFSDDPVVILKRAIVFVLHGFVNRNLTASAASLSFYTVTSIVPVMALLLSIVPVFGVDEALMVSIQKLFPFLGNTINAVWGVISHYGTSVEGSSPILTVVPLAMMVWCLYSLFYNVVHSLNEIWGVEDRNIGPRLSFYGLTILGVVLLMSIVTPILAYNPDILEKSVYLSVFLGVVFVYRVFPHATTTWKSAFVAASFFIAIFFLMNSVYMFLCDLIKDSYVKNYGKTFYIVFLLFTWLQFIWIFFLMGAMIGCVIDTHSRFTLTNRIKELSPMYKQYLTVVVATNVHRYYKEQKYVAIDQSKLLEDTKLPYSLVAEILKDLKSKNILWQQDDGKWRPTRDGLKLKELLLALSEGKTLLNKGKIEGLSDSKVEMPDFWKKYTDTCFAFYTECPDMETRLVDLPLSSREVSEIDTIEEMYDEYQKKQDPAMEVLPTEVSLISQESNAQPQWSLYQKIRNWFR